VVACPYQARTYLSKADIEYFPGQGLTEYEEMGNQLYPHQEGTVVKCNLCVERIDGGMREGLKAGKDREATPACVIACPVSARHFGDLDDPYSEVSTLIRERKGAPIHFEFDTRPSVYYID
jgi:Fe-S-cluster-containing dehydrogenase component